MDRIVMIVVSILLGGAIGYFVTTQFGEKVDARVQAVISEPKLVRRVEVTEVYSQNTAIAIRENTTFGYENNAAMMKQWDSTAQIGVDFTSFDWTQLNGIGQPVPDVGTVIVSGELPPLEVLNNFAVTGAEENTVVSRNRGYDEESELGPLLDAQKQSLMDCIADRALYRQETIDNAHEVILSLVSAAIPPREDGSAPVAFSLKFANEQELKATIAQRMAQPQACDQVVYD
ncbi:hypothetical protein [Pseudophaeobacter flagellatus]|uniref:hypothetical protein n=1 Tax=Pseudophaeobacter flagellatus TaxID=2899119 RepID=UPI001E478828|nr:hypothetical protein [Pseudophaeobacter flagellatus]MCD9148476.1 hypothetical protein [Pseudophaeobacter flagellatus]